jgi:4-aminobutyrate aminotransferase-like enzyme
MGNGHPLAAVVTTAEIAEEFSQNGYYFSTFAGNPVSAAVGTAVLDVMEKRRLPEQAARVGTYLKGGLTTLMIRHQVISDVRGPGLFIGVELGKGTPDAERASRVQNEMRQRGVLVGRTGPHGNVLKIRPPLVFEEQHADQLLTTLGEVLTGS